MHGPGLGMRDEERGRQEQYGIIREIWIQTKQVIALFSIKFYAFYYTVLIDDVLDKAFI